MDQCLEEITIKLHINWLFRPFSRCLKCNTLLVAARPEHYRQLSDNFKSTVTGLCYCPGCSQLFWEGGHVRRMRDQLEYFDACFGEHTIDR